MILKCPLCQGIHCESYFTDKKRQYFQCKRCDLVFADPQNLPTIEQEKAEYQLHQNHADDPGYQQFLQRTFRPLQQRLKQGAVGLDFGCGPTPVLATMLNQAGYPTDYYDPLFYPRGSQWKKRYDFISCTEAIEHFHQPHKEWALWQTLLKPGGVLAVMTKRVINRQRFAQWHYKNDPTHVSFFSERSFNWLAQQHQMQVEFIAADVVIFHKHQESHE